MRLLTIISFRIGEVVAVGEPKTGAPTRGAAGCADAGGIDIPLFGLAAKELQGAGGIVQGRFDGWISPGD